MRSELGGIMKRIVTLSLVFVLMLTCGVNTGFAEGIDDLNDIDAVDENSSPKDEKTNEPANESKTSIDETQQGDSTNTDKDSETKLPEKVHMTDPILGGKAEYYTAAIEIDGKLIDSDVPAILYKIDGMTRTLVPIRVISESLGGEVKWEQDELLAKIFYRGDVIGLKINEAKVLLNGVSKDLPSGVPAKLLSYTDITRTMVPVRFISETFGHKVDWDSKTRTVSVTSVQKSADNKVDDDKVGADKETTPSKSEKQAADEHRLMGVNLEESAEGKTLVLSLSGEDDVKWSSFFMPKGNGVALDRLVFDLQGVQLSMTEDERFDKSDSQLKESWTKGALKGVRCGQLEKDPAYVARVVVDMDGRHKYQVASKKSELRITFNGDLEDSTKAPEVDLDKKENSDGHDVVKKDETVKKDAEEYFNYHVVKPNEFAIMRINPDVQYPLNIVKNDSGVVQIEVNAEGFLPGLMNVPIGDGFVGNILVERADDKYTISVECAEGVVVYENPNTLANTLHELVFAKNQDLRAVSEGQKLVVLDPGHGGDDPGAVSIVDGTTELSVVETTVPMVKALLEQKGYKVLLTRDEDRYMSLYDRCKYPELAGADVFVSVHANATSNVFAKGIETFKKTSREKSASLATSILKHSLALTGAVNRGVKDYDLYITRESFVPSSLIELGFVSNAVELKKLKDPAYLEKLATGISLGIEEFLKQN